jgi:hypothetical protein
LTGEAGIAISSLVTSTIGIRRLPVPGRVIVVAVRWYLRYGLSYRDVEELLARTRDRGGSRHPKEQRPKHTFRTPSPLT